MSPSKSPLLQSGINRAVLALLGINLLVLFVIALTVFIKTIPTLAAGLSPEEAAPTSLPTAILQVETFTPTPMPPTNTVTPTPLPTSTATPTISPSPSMIPTQTLTSTITATPDVVLPDPEIIGRSVKGNPLEVYQFGSGPTERLIVAGIHGGYEHNTTQLAWALIKHLSANPDLIPGEVTLYILPVLNPDGLMFAESEYGRANANGVDLNRNWDADWFYLWPIDGCFRLVPLTGGNHPASEPETQALVDFIHAHQIDALISYHSAALGIFPGGKPPLPAAVDLAEQIATVSTYPYPPLDTGCVFTGQLIDWAAQENIAALDVELSTHRHIDWDTSLAILDVFLHWQAP